MISIPSVPLDGSRWSIHPEPTDEELVALVTTLTVVLSRPAASAAAATPRSGPSSRWARAGRIAALNQWPPTTGHHWRHGTEASHRR